MKTRNCLHGIPRFPPSGAHSFCPQVEQGEEGESRQASREKRAEPGSVRRAHGGRLIRKRGSSGSDRSLGNFPSFSLRLISRGSSDGGLRASSSQPCLPPSLPCSSHKLCSLQNPILPLWACGFLLGLGSCLTRQWGLRAGGGGRWCKPVPCLLMLGLPHTHTHTHMP